MSTAVAIDFGTSNSAVGFLKEGSPNLVELEVGKLAIPSAVFYDTEEKQTLFGNEAVSCYIDGCEGRLLRALKSILGSSLIDDCTAIGYKKIHFKEIIEAFISHLKKKAEQTIGSSVDSVVMGRPVRFVDSDDQRDAFAQSCLEEIAINAGFKNVLFQYEPIAAALDYEQSVSKEELALIVDIGGGTSDFSIVRVSPNRRGKEDRKADILANTGVHIGGTDLDRKLSLEQVMPLFGYKTKTRALFPGAPILDLPTMYFRELATWHRIVFLYNNKTLRGIKDLHYRAERSDLMARFVKIIQSQEGHRLASDVEKAKILLSEGANVSFPLDYIEQGLLASASRQKFENDIEQETGAIVAQIRECVKQAGIDSDGINTIFFTGGSTAIPVIAQACKNAVPCASVVNGNRFCSVVSGLTIDAGIRFGAIN